MSGAASRALSSHSCHRMIQADIGRLRICTEVTDGGQDLAAADNQISALGF